MERRGLARTAVPLAMFVWGGLVGLGLLALHSYESTPGRAGEPGLAWPASVDRMRAPGRANLVMFAHPRCPCTRASLAALADLVERSQGSAVVHVLFYQPPAGQAHWEQTELQRAAVALPGIRLHDDPGGTLAASFGAKTSGDVRLYDRAGKLVFAGGITAGRGQTGGNPGLAAVLAHLSGGSGARTSAPVFGCPIWLEAEPGEGGER